MGIFYPKNGKNDSDTIQISIITSKIETIEPKDESVPAPVNKKECVIEKTYKNFEKKLSQTLEAGGILPRPKASSGFWLGPLIGLCGVATFCTATSPTEIPLLMKITGIGLILSSICLVIQLLISKSASKNFQILYLVPVCATSALYLFSANKGLIVSVSWGLSVGSLGTWGVLQIMSKFPKCFTLGEAITVTHGIIFFLLSNGATSPLRKVILPGYVHALSTTVWQVGIISVGSLCLLYTFIPRIRTRYYFFLLAVGLFLIHFSPWLYIIRLEGVLTYGAIRDLAIAGRIPLIIYWTICLLSGAAIITYQVLSASCSTYATRMTFFSFAGLILIPGFIEDEKLLHLVCGIIMGLFIIFETIRFGFKSSPCNNTLMSDIADENNSSIPFSPLYCYLGIACPLWMHIFADQTIPRLSGVITIAVGDIAARLIGSRWGKHKWPGSNKTFEGTIACLVSQLFIFGLLHYWYLQFCGLQFVAQIMLVIKISLIEGFTDQVDNLVLPFIFYVGSALVWY